MLIKTDCAHSTYKKSKGDKYVAIQDIEYSKSIIWTDWNQSIQYCVYIYSIYYSVKISILWIKFIHSNIVDCISSRIKVN